MAKKKYCYMTKKGKRVCTSKFIVKPDKTPFVQEPDTGFMMGRMSREEARKLVKRKE